MGWNYDYRAGPEGGTLVVLSDIAENIRIIGDGVGPGYEGDDADVQYLHGERVNPEKYVAAGIVTVELTIRDTTSTGTITHADGAPGHRYENFTIAKKAFHPARKRMTLQRIAPHQGTVRINGQVMGGETIGDLEWRLLFPIVVADPPFWESTTLNSGINPVPTLAVGGNAIVDDILITFSGGSTQLTHTGSGRMVGLDGAPSGGVLNTRTGIVANGGTPLNEWLVASHANLMEMDGGETNSFSVAGGSVTIAYRNKWRL